METVVISNFGSVEKVRVFEWTSIDSTIMHICVLASSYNVEPVEWTLTVYGHTQQNRAKRYCDNLETKFKLHNTKIPIQYMLA